MASGTYDASQRDWYRRAREAGRPVWSEPYPLQNKQAMGQPALGITAAAPVFDRQRQFQGVFGVNITLSTLSAFLREQPVGPDSVSYIIDGGGRLVAASPADMPLTAAGPDGKPQRLPAAVAADARVAASVLALSPTAGLTDGLGDAVAATIGGQVYWVYVQRYRDAGLDWRVVSVVNPQPFLMGVRTTAQATLVLGVVLLGLLAWLVRRTTRRLAQPLGRLAEAVRAVGAGDLGRELPPMRGGREIDVLVEEFNRMSAALAQAREQVQGHARALEHTIAQRTAELSQANRALRTALQRSDAASRAKSRFVADLSHEVRTPLHTMLSLAWLLREQPLTEQQRHRLDQIDQAGHHLGDIVGGVLELARIESGESPLRPQPLSLQTLVPQAAAMMHERLARRGQPLRLEVPDDLPPVLGDATRLRQVLLNLLSNAARHADPGPVVLRVSWLPDAPAHGPVVALRFEVSDSGPGLTAERQAGLFRAFDPDRSEHLWPGSGLGLAIIRSLAERMGGRAGVDSQPGHGSTFHVTVRLPVAPGPTAPGLTVPEPIAPERTAPQDIAALPATIAQRHAGRPVLVVEDDPVSAEIAAALLAPTRLQVTVVDSPEQALHHLQRQPCALLITDVQFSHGHLDGLALIRALRELPAHATTPVIALTGVALAEEHARMRRAGIDHILTKPAAPGDVYALLLRVLN